MENIKKSPFIHIIAIAVAIAIVLGVSSCMLSFSASADTVSNSDNFDDDIASLPTLNGFTIIGSKCVTSIMMKQVAINYGAGGIFLMGYDHSTNTTYYTRFPQVFLHDGSQGTSFIYRYFPSGSDTVLFTHSADYNKDLGKYQLCEQCKSDVYNYLDVAVNSSNYKLQACFDLSILCDITLFDSTGKAVSDDFDYSSIKFYWCYSDQKQWNKKSAYQISDIAAISDNSGFKEAVTVSDLPTAEFTNFKGTEEAENYLFFVDWFDTGNRLPVADFRIDDNKNYHQYGLRISTNKKYVETLKSAWGEQEVREAIALSQNAVGNICIPLNHEQLFKRVAQLIVIKQVGTFSYDVERNITSDLMRFDENSNVNSKGISICLSDYVTIIPYCIYRLEIIDNNTSKVLDTVYFNSENGYSKGNSGYGTKVNDYESKSDLDDDLKNNNGFTGGTSSTGDVMDIDDPSDITDMGSIKAYGDIDITSIFGSLQSSSRALGSFFQACMNIIPAGILAVIIGGLSIVIILRILGR